MKWTAAGGWTAGVKVYATERRTWLAGDWLPTKWDWIDPAKDAAAEILQIEAGLKSRTQAIAERGYHAEQVDREIAAERTREAELGLDFRRPGSPAQVAGAAAGPSDVEGQQTFFSAIAAFLAFAGPHSYVKNIDHGGV